MVEKNNGFLPKHIEGKWVDKAMGSWEYLDVLVLIDLKKGKYEELYKLLRS
jgi:hypothetical protein